MVKYIILLLLSSCTISIIQTDTHGSASDVVDSEPETKTDASADIKIPAASL